MARPWSFPLLFLFCDAAATLLAPGTIDPSRIFAAKRQRECLPIAPNSHNPPPATPGIAVIGETVN
jgi:hypothetical protein